MSEYDREHGKRIKEWGIEGDLAQLIEGTAEHPIMYRALGTQPRTEHPFNLYGDIRSQPKALSDTFESNREVIPPLAQKLVDRGFRGMLGTGLGTSQFVAQTAAGAFRKYAGWEAGDVDSLEYVNNDWPIDFSRIAFFGYSGSGNTVDSNRAVDKAASLGAYTLAFTSVEGSKITQKCEDSIICAGGFDTGGSDTFHYTTRLAVSIWLALEIGALTHPDSNDWDNLRERLFALPDKMGAIFDKVDKRSRLVARRYRDARSVLVIGSAANEGTAEEIALKYDEMCHIPTKGMCPGRHIHGALGLTDHRILTIIVAPLRDPSYDALRDVAQVTQMLKSPSIAIVSEDDTEVAARVDDVFRLPEDEEIVFSVLAILPGQLLPYYAAVALGDINPDCQRADIPRHARVWNWLFPKDTH